MPEHSSIYRTICALVRSAQVAVVTHSHLLLFRHSGESASPNECARHTHLQHSCLFSEAEMGVVGSVGVVQTAACWVSCLAFQVDVVRKTAAFLAAAARG